MATLAVTAKGQIPSKKELLWHVNVSPGQKAGVEMPADGLAYGEK